MKASKLAGNKQRKRVLASNSLFNLAVRPFPPHPGPLPRRENAPNIFALCAHELKPREGKFGPAHSNTDGQSSCGRFPLTLALSLGERENESFGNGCNPTFEGIFTLLPTNQRLNRSLVTLDVFMSATSPRPSPPLKRGGEGAKGRRRLKKFGHRHTGSPWFVGGKNRLLAGWSLRLRTGALRGLCNRPSRPLMVGLIREQFKCVCQAGPTFKRIART
jgi:hypothetical protein